MGSFYGFSLN